MHTPHDLFPPFGRGLNYGAFHTHSLNCSDLLLHYPSLRKYNDSMNKRQGGTQSIKSGKKNENDLAATKVILIFSHFEKADGA